MYAFCKWSNFLINIDLWIWYCCKISYILIFWMLMDHLQQQDLMETSLFDRLDAQIWNLDTEKLKKNLRSIVIWLFMLSPSLAHGQDVQVKINPVPMIWVNIENEQPMIWANLELISVGNDERRLWAWINPAVYLDENMPSKLGPSIQATKKFNKWSEVRAIYGTHGWNWFVWVWWKFTLWGKKDKKKRG